MSELWRAFEGSVYLRMVRAAILGVALWLLNEDATAEAQKATGQPVTSLDVPASLIGLLGAVAGVLRGGEKNV